MCSAELEIALRLEALGAMHATEMPRASSANWSDAAREILIADPIEQFA
jgi:hypothetical protein